jgi:hypothetical protein
MPRIVPDCGENLRTAQTEPLWLIASPFWLDYGGVLRITHIVIGAFVVILAIIELCQDHEAIEN